jgi:hypothetical protein
MALSKEEDIAILMEQHKAIRLALTACDALPDETPEQKEIKKTIWAGLGAGLNDNQNWLNHYR